MKKKLLYLAATFLFVLCTISANASSNNKAIRDKVSNMTEVQKDERIQQIQERVNEIKAMDKSQLTKVERRDLRSELKDMNKEAKAIRGGGIYISVSAIIIIILLLILIL